VSAGVVAGLPSHGSGVASLRYAAVRMSHIRVNGADLGSNTGSSLSSVFHGRRGGSGMNLRLNGGSDDGNPPAMEVGPCQVGLYILLKTVSIPSLGSGRQRDLR
jgi:hypothetical protein